MGEDFFFSSVFAVNVFFLEGVDFQAGRLPSGSSVARGILAG